ncbi:hypothetical protein L3Q82_005176 [Scortum barcoo]|uniref:Uncharacterized protein n=1 Tax=Scortum barcoo TaxID=214431 RepID=A0ACB8VA25_9TELE|nr:hypothetical protein L3Q82_005176 [Scortum barcoo]
MSHREESLGEDPGHAGETMSLGWPGNAYWDPPGSAGGSVWGLKPEARSFCGNKVEEQKRLRGGRNLEEDPPRRGGQVTDVTLHYFSGCKGTCKGWKSAQDVKFSLNIDILKHRKTSHFGNNNKSQEGSINSFSIFLSSPVLFQFISLCDDVFMVSPIQVFDDDIEVGPLSQGGGSDEDCDKLLKALYDGGAITFTMLLLHISIFILSHPLYGKPRLPPAAPGDPATVQRCAGHAGDSNVQGPTSMYASADSLNRDKQDEVVLRHSFFDFDIDYFFLSLCVFAAEQQHACMFASSTSRSIMEVKERRPYCSLSKSRKDKEGQYTGSSGDSEDCAIGSQGGLRVPTQKSYSSSETLKAFDQHQDQTRLLYGTTKGHKDMVHREQDDYNRQGQHFSLRQLGICDPPSRRGLAFCSEMGLPHRGFSVGTSQDLDTDSQAVMSPERAMRLWGRGGLGKSSGRSSCLSSRSNSVLTLTDTEHENKSDSDNGSPMPSPSCPSSLTDQSHPQSANPHDNPLLGDMAEPDSEEGEEEEEEEEEEEYAARLYLPVIHGEASGRHPCEMPKPPQLTPLDMAEEQRLYSEPLADVRAPPFTAYL